jgi:predicted dehydrogenase
MQREELRVAVVGLGMGKSHLRAVLAFGASVCGICDIDRDRMLRVAEEFGLSEKLCYDDYGALLREAKPNAVIIATPDQLHKEMILAALSAGAHVLCEKPLALTREELREIVCAARSSDRKVMVGQICRFTPGFLKAKEILDRGEIGELFYVESEYAHDYVNILAPGNWRTDPLRNGVVGGGCHAMDLLRWYVGDPEEIFAYGVHKLLPQVPYDDTHISVLKFPNGVIGKIFVSTSAKRNYTMRTLLYGTKGTIICDNTSPSIQVFRIVEGKNTVSSVPEEIPVHLASHNTVAEFEVFARHILEDTPVVTDVIEGAKTVSACLAVIESATSGGPIRPQYDI